MQLTEAQKQFLTGSLLGDGSLNKSCRHARFCFGSTSWQYALWAFDLLTPLTKTPPVCVVKSRQGMPSKKPFYVFRTVTSPALDELYERFYRHGKKVVPPDLVLTPQSIAAWLMDDGSMSDGLIQLHSESFSKKENEHLAETLLASFGIRASVVRARQYWRLSVSALGSCKLSALVAEHVLDTFSYKLVKPMDRFCIKAPLEMPSFLLPDAQRLSLCRHCGKQFPRKTNKAFCDSPACITARNTANHRRWRERKLKNTEEFRCVICGREFQRPIICPSMKARLTCSESCHQKLVSSRRTIESYYANLNRDPMTGRFIASR